MDMKSLAIQSLTSILSPETSRSKSNIVKYSKHSTAIFQTVHFPTLSLFLTPTASRHLRSQNLVRLNRSYFKEAKSGSRFDSLPPGNITFSSVGFRPSIPVVDVGQLPGNFVCDDDDLNEIWKLGARAASVACVEQGSQKMMWEVDDNGAFVRGMRSGLSAEGAFFKDYTLEFDAKIERGGIGWAVVSGPTFVMATH